MSENYPSKADLQRIKKWPFSDYKGLAVFICTIWNWGDTMAVLKRKRDGNLVLRLATGGWSGNEEIIATLMKTPFWFVCWQMSQRGGLYVFEIPKELSTNSTK